MSQPNRRLPQKSVWNPNSEFALKVPLAQRFCKYIFSPHSSLTRKLLEFKIEVLIFIYCG